MTTSGPGAKQARSRTRRTVALNAPSLETLRDLDDVELHGVDEIVTQFEELDPHEAGMLSVRSSRSLENGTPRRRPSPVPEASPCARSRE